MSTRAFIASVAAALAALGGACEVFFENYYVEVHPINYVGPCDEFDGGDG